MPPASRDGGQQADDIVQADIVFFGRRRLTQQDLPGCSTFGQHLTQERVRPGIGREDIRQPDDTGRWPRIGQAQGFTGQFGEIVKVGWIAGTARQRRVLMGRYPVCIDAGRGQEQKRIVPQSAQTPCGDADMRLRRVERARAEIARQADAVDHMSGGPAGCQESGEIGSSNRLHLMFLDAQMLGQSLPDRAAGAQDSEKTRFHGRLLRHSHISARDKIPPLPWREGAGGRGFLRDIRAVFPLPPAPSRKGRGRLFSSAEMGE